MDDVVLYLFFSPNCEILMKITYCFPLFCFVIIHVMTMGGSRILKSRLACQFFAYLCKFRGLPNKMGTKRGGWASAPPPPLWIRA